MLDIPSLGATRLCFSGLQLDGTTDVCVDTGSLVIAGWAGRDPDAIEAHVRELEKIGVARPRSIPTYYRVAASLLTQAPRIDVVGEGSSGEAEVVLLHSENGYWVTVGSDHTDRKLEAVGVSLSKQVCAKPLGTACWRLDDLRDHWDELILRCLVTARGREEIYQEGPLSGLRTPESLIEGYLATGNAFPAGSIMFCGTVPVIDELRFADRVTLELADPVLGRTLTHSYDVRALEIAD